jgi:hypothetical protein
MRAVISTVLALSFLFTASSQAQTSPVPIESAGLKAIVARTNEFQSILSKPLATETEYLALAKGACDD